MLSYDCRKDEPIDSKTNKLQIAKQGRIKEDALCIP